MLIFVFVFCSSCKFIYFFFVFSIFHPEKICLSLYLRGSDFLTLERHLNLIPYLIHLTFFLLVIVSYYFVSKTFVYTQLSIINWLVSLTYVIFVLVFGKSEIKICGCFSSILCSEILACMQIQHYHTISQLIRHHN